jgi:K+-transporting ATPase A subunit
VTSIGPVASQEAIKELGTNGGGFFNANSAHEVETSNYAPVIAFDQSFSNNTDATDTMTPSVTRSDTNAFSLG